MIYLGSLSNAYTSSMHSNLRERGYMRFVIQVTNDELQNGATVTGSFAPYSDSSNVFKARDWDYIDTNIDAMQRRIATFETNVTKVNGGRYLFYAYSMFATDAVKERGIVSEKLVSETPAVFTINLNTTASFKGLTLFFGTEYPVDFSITDNNGNEIVVTDNTSEVWSTDRVFFDASFLVIRCTKMRYPDERLFIGMIRFGYDLILTNNVILDSSYTAYNSPIVESLPQIILNLTVRNDNKVFDLEDKYSVINYISQDTKVIIQYGYALPGYQNSDGIYWMRTDHLYLSECTVNGDTVTIICKDILQKDMGAFEYPKHSGDTDVDLDLIANMACEDAGIPYKSFYMRNLSTYEPIKKYSYKELLQMLANASQCRLIIKSTGEITTEASFFKPVYSATCNGEASYSHVENILNGQAKRAYSKTYSTYNIGYTSSMISKDDCTFDVNPIITLTIKYDDYMYSRLYGLCMVCGVTTFAECVIRFYHKKDSRVETKTFVNTSQDKAVIFNIYADWFDVVKAEFEFTKTAKPNTPITIDNIAFDNALNYIIRRDDMLNEPRVIKNESVGEITLIKYDDDYTRFNSHSREIITEMDSYVLESGKIETFEFSDAYTGYEIYLDEQQISNEQIVVSKSTAYSVALQYKIDGAHKLTIKGIKINVRKHEYKSVINKGGKSITWDNPFCSNHYTDDHMMDYLKQYYKHGIEYEYEFRGDPILEVGDVVAQETEYGGYNIVQIVELTLTFNGAFGGKIRTRQVGWD